MRISGCSSDVCSSDLRKRPFQLGEQATMTTAVNALNRQLGALKRTLAVGTMLGEALSSSLSMQQALRTQLEYRIAAIDPTFWLSETDITTPSAPFEPKYVPHFAQFLAATTPPYGEWTTSAYAMALPLRQA